MQYFELSDTTQLKRGEDITDTGKVLSGMVDFDHDENTFS